MPAQNWRAGGSSTVEYGKHNQKAPEDVVPSGHHLRHWSKIITNTYILNIFSFGVSVSMTKLESGKQSIKKQEEPPCERVALASKETKMIELFEDWIKINTRANATKEPFVSCLESRPPFRASSGEPPLDR